MLAEKEEEIEGLEESLNSFRRKLNTLVAGVDRFKAIFRKNILSSLESLKGQLQAVSQ